MRYRSAIVAGVALLGLAAAASHAPARLAVAQTPSPTNGLTIQVGAGVTEPEGSIQIEAFLPESIVVTAGDTVNWKVTTSGEPHTVTFQNQSGDLDILVPTADGQGLRFNPQVGFPTDVTTYTGTEFVNSGQITAPDPNTGEGNSTFSLTFATPGVYRYRCLIHPQMNGTVVVNAPGAPVIYPNNQLETQAALDQVAQDEIATYAEEGREALAAANVMQATANADGTTTYTLTAGVYTQHTDVLAFLPPNLAVKPGDTVNWVNYSGAPHTVTFLSGTQAPDFIVPTPQPNGPPDLLVNPQAIAPSVPSDTYSGSGFYNSGLLGFGPPGTPSTFTLKFSGSGTYEYLCLIHGFEGMVGHITVSQ